MTSGVVSISELMIVPFSSIAAVLALQDFIHSLASFCPFVLRKDVSMLPIVSPSLAVHSPRTMVATSETYCRSVGTRFITLVDVSTVAATASCTGCRMFLFTDPVRDCKPWASISTSMLAFSTATSVTGISLSICSDMVSTSFDAFSVAFMAAVVSMQAWSKLLRLDLNVQLVSTNMNVTMLSSSVFTSLKLGAKPAKPGLRIGSPTVCVTCFVLVPFEAP
mmetsp:Transcript_16049/g.45957  ORF Transcript_16049/g.45957 Transcript_16049/m.45957 type:complete len:221 (-) Transcript_16049:446-1108(-)